MTIPSPDHLFEQAEQLINASGSLRQENLRRAISNACYAVFHATLTAAADHIIGHRRRSSARYSLVYRSITHRALRQLCTDIQKTHLPQRYRQFVPATGLGPDIGAFAETIVELQRRREAADYDPVVRFARSDARFAVNLGRTALRRFEVAPKSRREAFLVLLLFPPRVA